VSHSIHIPRFEAALSGGGVAATVSVAGELDLSTRGSLAQKVREALDDDISLLVLNLEEVSFIDAAGLSGLIQAFHQSQGRGIECEIKPSRCVQRMLGLVGAPRELVGDPALAYLAEEGRGRACGANSAQRSEAIAASSVTAARGHVVRETATLGFRTGGETPKDARSSPKASTRAGGEMTARSIVCGVDETQHARFALLTAERFARKLGLRLVVVHVAEHVSQPSAFMSSNTVRLATQDHRETLAALDLVERAIGDEGVANAEAKALHGDPAECLADVADEERAEMIVVGSRGLGAFKTVFLGSVSNALIGVARCPVLVVPPGATADDRPSV
jgi:anti-anti-sigma factor